MSSPSDPQQPAAPTGFTQSSTQEIPVVPPSETASAGTPLPPHPDAAAPVPAGAPVAAQPTGPVDFVPGLPGLGTPPVPPPAAATPAPPPPVPPRPVDDIAAPEVDGTRTGPTWPDTLDADDHATPPRRRRVGVPRDRSTLLGLGLVVLSIALLELGLVHDFGGESYWSSVPLWSAFATVCAVLGLAAFAGSLPAAARLRPGTAWRAAAGGLVGLAVFWLLVVLSVVDSDRGFVLTASLAALGGALWIGARAKA